MLLPYALSCLFVMMVCVVLSVLLMLVGAPLWSFLVLGCVGVIVLMLFLYLELEDIDRFSSLSENEKLLNQKRRKHWRSIFMLVTGIVLVCLLLGCVFAVHYFAVVT